MSDLSRIEKGLKKSKTRYRPVVIGNIVKIYIFGLNAPEVWMFRDGKYIR